MTPVHALPWIVGGGVLMTAIALAGSITLVLSEAALRRVLFRSSRSPRAR